MTKNTRRIVLDVVPELHDRLMKLYLKETSRTFNGASFSVFLKGLLAEACLKQLSVEERAVAPAPVQVAAPKAKQPEASPTRVIKKPGDNQYGCKHDEPGDILPVKGEPGLFYCVNCNEPTEAPTGSKT